MTLLLGCVLWILGMITLIIVNMTVFSPPQAP
jgi:hypothetical protein